MADLAETLRNALGADDGTGVVAGQYGLPPLRAPSLANILAGPSIMNTPRESALAQALGMHNNIMSADPYNIAMGVVPGPLAKLPPNASARPMKWFHGSDNDFQQFDLSRAGSGAWSEYFSRPPTRPAAFLADNEKYASKFGQPRAFEASGKYKTIDAAAELEDWAKELGYPNAQAMVNKYFEGSIYRALDADNFFNNAFAGAKKEGFDGVIVDFGKIVGRDAHGRTLITDNIGQLKRVP